MRALAALAAVLAFLCARSLDALADCGNTVAASVAGDWQVRVVQGQPTGGTPAPLARDQPGATAVDHIRIVETCPSPGACSFNFKSLDPGAPPGPPFYSQVSSLEGPFDDNLLRQSGSTYSTVFPVAGIGGPNLPPCRPPSHGFDRTLTMQVVTAIPSAGASGWQATLITGSETIPSNWSCNGSVGFITTVLHITLVAVHLADTLPPVGVIPCLATPAATAVPGSTIPSSAPPANPATSTIASALAAPGNAFPSLTQSIVGALITLGVMLFVTFPSVMFNHTLEENYDEIRDILERRVRRLRRLGRQVAESATAGRQAALFGAVVLTGALLGGLNDPNFGFNGASATTYTAVIISILFGAAMSTAVNVSYRRARGRETRAHLHALPAGLLVAAMCVLVSRLTQFTPGYLYGVIAGVAFSGKLAKNEEGHSVALGTTVTLVVGVLAWFLWVPVNDSATRPGAAVPVVLLDDFLASLFIGGLVGSVIGLLPLRFLPGGTLSEWNRWVWGVMFGIAVFGLIQVMLRPESESAHPGKAPLVTAILLFTVFGGASVAFRSYFSIRKRRRRLAEVHT